jgi:phthiocerol/phenolphthiocerol synthesis type-I polyketide synthase E
MSDGRDDGQATGMEVAIIGMAGRFPGARNVEEYWRNLVGGVESITTFTAEELEAAGEDPALVAHPDYVPVARVIDDIEMFDAAFFAFSPREAEILDPQQRLYIECVHEALEHAGYDVGRYPGPIGVFGGSRMPSYLLNLYRNPGVIATVGDFHAQLSNDKDYVATRVAYKLNLGGPSVTVQTACSTALVGLHLACQSLLAGEADMAVAGAVAVRVPQVQGYLFRDGDVGSPDGRVRPFDARARGTIFGSGLGAVVLKRLEDAVADDDTIYAVIKGSAINNDAAAKVGFTAPGADGQARVIRAAQVTAGVEPDTIGYVEAHGTGTPMGDPIEIGALRRAFAERTDRKRFCGIGSAKGNIGHAGVAAGIAGLIKTVCALRRELIPPSILFAAPNPQIDFEDSPFYVVTEPTPWAANGRPRRAAVSAFGIGGTNAHVILEEAPERRPGSASRPWQLLVLSARTPTALDAATARLAAHLADHPEDDLADVAFTLQVGREAMEHRRTLVAASREDAVAALADPARLLAGSPRGRSPRVVYLFSGQGAQHVGMGRGLYRGEPVFRAELDRAAELLMPHLGLDLREVLYPEDAGAEARPELAARLEQTALTQPALFAVEHALARLWMEWGVAPQAMMGHSIGEYVAACLAGVMTLPDALSLVAARGRLMQGLPAGAMLTVPLSEAEVAPLLGRQLSLAATNAPARSVVSGPAEAVEALAERLAASGIAGSRRLHTSHAFHSGMMEPILAPFLAEVKKVDLRPPQLPYISNVTGTWITAAEATAPEYWVRHLRGTVRFAEGLAELFGEGDALLLEVGPGKSLASLARQQPGRPPSVAVLSSLRHPRDAGEDLPHLLGALGQLWANGAAVDWAGFYARERRLRLALPTYPFERKRFWIDPAEGSPLFAAGAGAPRKKKDLADWFYLPCWKPAVLPLAPSAPARGGDGAAPRWLVFADGEGLADRLAAHLRAEGAAVSLVEPGAGFAALAPDRFAVAPGGRGDYDSLFAALRAAGGLPDVIAHLWGVSAGPGGPVPEAELAAAMDRGFYSLLHLAQGLVKSGAAGRAIRIGVVGNGLYRVLPGDLPVPEKAAVLGPVKVIPQECSSFACRSVDVPWPLGHAEAAELVELLAAELAQPAAEGAEPIVAYRGGERWTQGYQAVRFEEPHGSSLQIAEPHGSSLRVHEPYGEASQPRLRERGVYLITGGMGGLGLVFAEHLAREARARLVLVGRSPLPERAAWDAWLASHPAADPVSEKILKLRELEALGAEVLAVRADVADPAAMRGALAAAGARFGPLHGVIHSAGVAGGGILQLKTREMAERVLAPKVRGTRVLDALLAESPEPLDFFVLCSSTVAVLGGFGQIDYCGANNYLDAYAQARSAAGGAGLTVSIDWSAWQETGMALDTAPPPSLREAGRPAEAIRDPLHPLIDRRLSAGPDEAVFATEFSAERHWALDEHRILGIGALPGTTWIELARAAYALRRGDGDGGAATAEAVEIRDLLFQTPLMVQAGESKEVRITLTRDGQGCVFRIASALPAPAGGEPAWQEHARGRIAAGEASAEIRHDVESLFAACEREVDLGSAVAGRQSAVSWGPRWLSLRRAAAGDRGAMIELELPAEFHSDVERLAIHPALLDVATATGSLLGHESFLPLAYRRILFRRPLPPRLFSRLRRTDDGSSRETIRFDVTLLDATGAELMAIEGFTMKRLGEGVARLQQPAAAPPAGAEKAKGLLAAGGMLSREGVEALRRVLSLRRAPQVVVSPRDLAALLAQSRAVDRSRLLERAGEVRAPQASHPRPDLPNPYVAPGSELEGKLAAIWQAALGIRQVGIHDNFFDLGGDSVLGVQMISRCAEAGLQLSPEQLFEHQTIAELAAVLPGAVPAPVAAAADEAGPAAPLPDASLSQAELDQVFASLERLSS